MYQALLDGIVEAFSVPKAAQGVTPGPTVMLPPIVLDGTVGRGGEEVGWDCL